jgi:hypothetical protein
MLWSRASARPGVTPHGRLGRAAVVCSSGAAPFFDPSSHNSIEWLQQQQQQQLLRQPPQQLAGIASARAGAVSMAQESASQESDLLWAGYRCAVAAVGGAVCMRGQRAHMHAGLIRLL